MVRFNVTFAGTEHNSSHDTHDLVVEGAHIVMGRTLPLTFHLSAVADSHWVLQIFWSNYMSVGSG